MREFFSNTVGRELSWFSIEHIALFVFVIIGAILIITFRTQIRNYKHERKVAKIVAIAAFLWEIALYLWMAGNGEYTIPHSLPIGLCAFTLYIGIFALYFKNFGLFEIGYFWTWGAIASILFPDILYSVDRFRFYQFTLGHINFFLMFIYMIFVYQWYPTWKSWKKSCITLTIIVFILIIASNITNENLMYMLNADDTPFSMFEGNGYFLYLLGVISMSFGIIFVWFTPFMLYHRKNNKRIKD